MRKTRDLPLTAALEYPAGIVMVLAILQGTGIEIDKRQARVTANRCTLPHAKMACTSVSLNRNRGRDAFGDSADQRAKRPPFAAQTVKSVQSRIGESTYEQSSFLSIGSALRAHLFCSRMCPGSTDNANVGSENPADYLLSPTGDASAMVQVSINAFHPPAGMLGIPEARTLPC